MSGYIGSKRSSSLVSFDGGTIRNATLDSTVSGLSNLITTENTIDTTSDTGEITGNTQTAFGDITSLAVVSGDKLLVLVQGGVLLLQFASTGNNFQPSIGFAYSFDNFATTPTYQFQGRFLATATSTENLQVTPAIIALLTISTTGTIYIKPALYCPSTTTARWNAAIATAPLATTLIRIPQ